MIKVHPAYTSVIGRFKYQSQYGINVHQSAALVIGRRALGIRHERVPKPFMDLCITKEKQEAFQLIHNWKQWSAIKKLVVKKLKMKGGNLISWLDCRKKLMQTMS